MHSSLCLEVYLYSAYFYFMLFYKFICILCNFDLPLVSTVLCQIFRHLKSLSMMIILVYSTCFIRSVATLRSWSCWFLKWCAGPLCVKGLRISNRMPRISFVHMVIWWAGLQKKAPDLSSPEITASCCEW